MGEYSVGIATKNRIFSVAKELFYEKGVEKTSYSDISEIAEVNRGLIPYYFKSKNNIAELVFDEFIASMENAVKERWPEDAIPQTIKDILLEYFQFRLLEENENILRFYAEITGSSDYHAKMFEVQNIVMDKMLAAVGASLADTARPTVTCMMSGTEIELVQALRTGYLAEPVEDYVRRDLQWVYFLLGVSKEVVEAWCDEAYALAEGLTMECGSDFTCKIVDRS